MRKLVEGTTIDRKESKKTLNVEKKKNLVNQLM